MKILKNGTGQDIQETVTKDFHYGENAKTEQISTFITENFYRVIIM